MTRKLTQSPLFHPLSQELELECVGRNAGDATMHRDFLRLKIVLANHRAEGALSVISHHQRGKHGGHLNNAPPSSLRVVKSKLYVLHTAGDHCSSHVNLKADLTPFVILQVRPIVNSLAATLARRTCLSHRRVSAERHRIKTKRSIFSRTRRHLARSGPTQALRSPQAASSRPHRRQTTFPSNSSTSFVGHPDIAPGTHARHVSRSTAT